MNKILLHIFMCALILTLTGCGTLFSSSRKTVNISTNTNETVNAQVMNVKGEQYVQIPAAVVVEGSSEDLVINVKDNQCYENTTTTSARKLNKWVVLNIFFGLTGLSGTTTDSASGTLWDYDDDIMVNLKKKPNCHS